MTKPKTRRINAADLAIGDTIVILGKGYRVTGFEPYEGSLSCILSRIVCVEGHGPFVSDDGTGWEVYA